MTLYEITEEIYSRKTNRTPFVAANIALQSHLSLWNGRGYMGDEEVRAAVGFRDASERYKVISRYLQNIGFKLGREELIWYAPE